MQSLESTMTVKEAGELLNLMLTHHGQSRRDILILFADFFMKMSTVVAERSSSAWSERMSRAAACFNSVNGSMRSEEFSKERLQLSTAIIALSSATDATPTLDFFRLNTPEILIEVQSFRSMHQVDQLSIQLSMRSVFMFWLAFDQLRIIEESRSIVEDALAMSLSKFVEENAVVARWFSLMMTEKFDASICTSVLDDTVMVISR